MLAILCHRGITVGAQKRKSAAHHEKPRAAECGAMAALLLLIPAIATGQVTLDVSICTPTVSINELPVSGSRQTATLKRRPFLS